MTLSPVFRSRQAVRLLEEHGIWERLGPTVAIQAEAVATIYADLERVIGSRYRRAEGGDAGGWMSVGTTAEGDAADEAATGLAAAERDPELAFIQDFFFLILFLSLFESLGIAPERLPFYAELDFCIMGTITAADNLFDDQSKSLLPLRRSVGARYGSILQLMCFERLVRRAGDRAVAAGLFDADAFARVQMSLLDQMAEIGLLEGSEENGVASIPTPAEMIDKVHRVRGGMLFGLAFAGPHTLEAGETLARLRQAEPAIARLGTAFQIVDDLTDFEFDLTRHSHNLLVSHIYHHGSSAEKARLEALWGGAAPEPGMVEGIFAESARAVLDLARTEAVSAFETLARLGFWFPAELAAEVVYAIVGLDGVARMEALQEG